MVETRLNLFGSPISRVNWPYLEPDPAAADAGVIPLIRTSGDHRLFDLAAVRAAIARGPWWKSRRHWLLRASQLGDTSSLSWAWQSTTCGLVDDLQLDVYNEAGRIIAYAFMETLNNAIDHSGSHTATITLWISSDQWCFEIKDKGIGANTKLKEGLRLGSEFEAVQELSRERTTDPVRHTGEGILHFEGSGPLPAYLVGSALDCGQPPGRSGLGHSSGDGRYVGSVPDRPSHRPSAC